MYRCFRDDEADIKNDRKEARDEYLNKNISDQEYENRVDGVPITFRGYQESVEWSATRNPELDRITYMCLGIGGESGEIIDNCKKMHRANNGVLTESRKKKIEEEMGDLLYYLAGLANAIGSDLEIIAHRAQIKAVKRFRKFIAGEFK